MSLLADLDALDGDYQFGGDDQRRGPGLEVQGAAPSQTRNIARWGDPRFPRCRLPDRAAP